MIFFLITLGLWFVGFAVFWRLPIPRGTPNPGAYPSLSIVIPARNEATNLPALLRSILSQSVQPLEVIVVNDGSTDRTAAVAREFDVTVLESLPLPDGWRGKTWACHQGAALASGEVFLFLDADTWIEPGGLRKILDTYLASGGALSVGPYHAVQRPYEQLSAFFNLAMTAGTGAFTLLGSALPPRGLFGQMLMVSRTDYLRVKGHEAVKNRTLENFALARHFRAAGVPLRCYGGTGVLAFRMYPNGLKELVDGWAKAFASGAGGTARPLLFLIVAWMCGMFFALNLLAAQPNGQSTGLYLLFALQLYAMLRRIGSFRWVTALFYPVALIFFCAVFAWSAIRSRGQVQWKGRIVDAD
ncbi:MAG: glycosyltransferase [Chthoniobacteraceae bacterium]